MNYKIHYSNILTPFHEVMKYRFLQDLCTYSTVPDDALIYFYEVYNIGDNTDIFPRYERVFPEDVSHYSEVSVRESHRYTKSEEEKEVCVHHDFSGTEAFFKVPNEILNPLQDEDFIKECINTLREDMKKKYMHKD